MTLARRGLLRDGISLGALTLLTGCDVSDDDAVQRVLAAFSRWNDKVQAALFSEHRLAPTFPEAIAVTKMVVHLNFLIHCCCYRKSTWHSLDVVSGWISIGNCQFRQALARLVIQKSQSRALAHLKGARAWA